MSWEPSKLSKFDLRVNCFSTSPNNHSFESELATTNISKLRTEKSKLLIRVDRKYIVVITLFHFIEKNEFGADEKIEFVKNFDLWMFRIKLCRISSSNFIQNIHLFIDRKCKCNFYFQSIPLILLNSTFWPPF